MKEKFESIGLFISRHKIDQIFRVIKSRVAED